MTQSWHSDSSAQATEIPRWSGDLSIFYRTASANWLGTISRWEALPEILRVPTCAKPTTKWSSALYC